MIRSTSVNRCNDRVDSYEHKYVIVDLFSNPLDHLEGERLLCHYVSDPEMSFLMRASKKRILDPQNNKDTHVSGLSPLNPSFSFGKTPNLEGGEAMLSRRCITGDKDENVTTFSHLATTGNNDGNITTFSHLVTCMPTVIHSKTPSDGMLWRFRDVIECNLNDDFE